MSNTKPTKNKRKKTKKMKNTIPQKTQNKKLKKKTKQTNVVFLVGLCCSSF
jgi:hypothetical protein